MTKPSPNRTVDITAYDGMVVFSGLGESPVILSAEAAEQVGYQLSAAAFAAASGAVRTWSGPARCLPAGREAPAAKPAPQAVEEPRSFLPPIDQVSGSA